MPEYANFFEKEGLKVSFVQNDGGTAALQQVATGNADFSLNNPQAVINAVGQGLPVVGVATAVPRQIYGFYLPDGSPIKSYADLKGKKIGISSPTSGVYPFAQAALASEGIDPNNDVTFVTTGSGAPQLAALKSGNVDVLATWDTQVATFANLGENLTALPATEIANQPADLITTNTTFLKQHPDQVVAFSRAILESIAYAEKHPDQALAAFKAEFPQAATGSTDDQNMKVIQSRLDTLKLSDAQKGWGDMPMAGYQQLQDVSVQYGAIKTAQDLTKVLDPSLLPQIQDFDANSL
jgi:NitT/TauT family transport system substrate-binding protein